VHGGGFYHVQKYAVAPEVMPTELHWFKYEAYFTWLSGFALLVVTYYFSASSYLIDPGRADLTPITAIGASLAFLIGSWLIYEALCRCPIGRSTAALALSVFALIIVSAYLLTQIFSDRAAFLHVGALIGTIMSANVFVVIIPNQKKVVADLVAGNTPDPTLGAQAKQRSLHNNYLTLPVLLLMMSAHYPMLFSGGRGDPPLLQYPPWRRAWPGARLAVAAGGTAGTGVDIFYRHTWPGGIDQHHQRYTCPADRYRPLRWLPCSPTHQSRLQRTPGRRGTGQS
jgi:hypothetical protein